MYLFDKNLDYLFQYILILIVGKYFVMDCIQYQYSEYFDLIIPHFHILIKKLLLLLLLLINLYLLNLKYHFFI